MKCLVYASEGTKILGKVMKPGISGKVRKCRKGRVNWSKSILIFRKEK